MISKNLIVHAISFSIVVDLESDPCLGIKVLLHKKVVQLSPLIHVFLKLCIDFIKAVFTLLIIDGT